MESGAWALHRFHPSLYARGDSLKLGSKPPRLTSEQ